MAEERSTDRTGEMEEQLSTLEDHIDDAEKKLADRRGDAGVGGKVTGEFHDEQDRGGGDDPVGAAQDAEEGSGASAGKASTSTEEPDALEPDEAQSPT